MQRALNNFQKIVQLAKENIALLEGEEKQTAMEIKFAAECVIEAHTPRHPKRSAELHSAFPHHD